MEQRRSATHAQRGFISQDGFGSFAQSFKPHSKMKMRFREKMEQAHGLQRFFNRALCFALFQMHAGQSIKSRRIFRFGL